MLETLIVGIALNLITPGPTGQSPIRELAQQPAIGSYLESRGGMLGDLELDRQRVIAEAEARRRRNGY